MPALTLLEPAWLAFLTVIAALVAAYVLAQRQRHRYAVRFTDVALIDQVMPDRPAWRRHVPAAASLLALALLVLALAQPVLRIDQRQEVAVVLLAIDVSPSMQATDVPPNRLTQAKSAANRFVDLVPPTFEVGLVAFAGTAEVLVPPTTDHALVRRAVDHLDYRSETAIGEAIFASLGAVSTSLTGDDAPRQILLLSDGDSTVGRPVDEAMAAAAEASVPVVTIAFGTPDGAVELGGQLRRVAPDADTLERIAQTTGGDFFHAVTGAELRRAYEQVSGQLSTVRTGRPLVRETVGGALVLSVMAAAMSLAWFSRLP